MPQYRKLHAKIRDSEDVNDMPDDFHRLLWTWLPLILDREGRGIYNPAWIKSKTFPLRQDITPEKVQAAMQWFAQREMVQVYSVKTRRYFCIPTFHDYQGDTKKEAGSVLPAPPVKTNSVPTPELGGSKSSTDVDVDSDANVDSNADADADAAGQGNDNDDPAAFIGELGQVQSWFITASGIPIFSVNERMSNALKELAAQKPTFEEIETAVAETRDKYGAGAVTGPWSIVTPLSLVIAKRNGNGTAGIRAGPPGNDKPKTGLEKLRAMRDEARKAEQNGNVSGSPG